MNCMTGQRGSWDAGYGLSRASEKHPVAFPRCLGAEASKLEVEGETPCSDQECWDIDID